MSIRDLVSTIKNLVKLEVALIALIFVAMFFTDAYLPVELQEFIGSEYESVPTTVELLPFIVLFFVALVNMVSLFGLLAVKTWARKSFIYSTVLIYPLCLFIGPQVDHAVDYTLDQLSVLIQGMILSLLIFNSSYQESALNKVRQKEP